ncbi:hypothetical protein BV921_02840 [Pectobacterium odoriferum]|nr:hypothetical protein BV921_02840 [Pectobacterium odoriferum]
MVTVYPSYFELHVRWLRSVTRITYLSKLIGIPSLAAFLKLELFRVYIGISPRDCRLIFRRITERSVTVFTIGTGFQCYKL